MGGGSLLSIWGRDRDTVVMYISIHLDIIQIWSPRSIVFLNAPLDREVAAIRGYYRGESRLPLVAFGYTLVQTALGCGGGGSGEWRSGTE